MAQEMLLTKNLNDTGRIISADWIYTTELRVYNINLSFRDGLYLFPDNWMYARAFGSLCVYLMFLFSIYMFFDACGNRDSWIYAGIMLMIPVSTMYCFLGLFGLCYVFYPGNILFVISCVLRRSKAGKVITGNNLISAWIERCEAVSAVLCAADCRLHFFDHKIRK